jgi:hypothetical protein
MLAGLVAMLLASADGLEPASVASVLSTSLAAPRARLELLELHPSLPAGCVSHAVHFERRLSASGRYAVKLAGNDSSGGPCQGWAWARVRVLTRVIVTTRSVKNGEPLGSAVLEEEREVLAGHTPLEALPEHALAAQSLKPGLLLEPFHVRSLAPAPGEPVTVVARSGEVSIVQHGRAVPCARGRSCARLASGKRVEGRLEQGRLVVEVP